MRRFICSLLAALSVCAASVKAQDWPMDSVRKSLDYLYDRVISMQGGSSNFVGTLETSGGILTYTKDGVDYTLILTTNALRQALASSFLSTNTPFGGAVSGVYSNLVLSSNLVFGGVVAGPYTNLQFNSAVVTNIILEGGILYGELDGYNQYIRLYPEDIQAALQDWALTTETEFDGVVQGTYNNLTWGGTDWDAEVMKKSDYDPDDDGKVTAVDVDGVDSDALQDESVTGAKLAPGSVSPSKLASSMYTGDLGSDIGLGVIVDGLHGKAVPDPDSVVNPRMLIADGFGNWAFATPSGGDMNKVVYDTIFPGDGTVDSAIEADYADVAITASQLNSKPVQAFGYGDDYLLAYDLDSQQYVHKPLVDLGLSAAVLSIFDLDEDGILDHANLADTATTATTALSADRLLGIPIDPPSADNTGMFYDYQDNKFFFADPLTFSGGAYMLKSTYDSGADGRVDAVDYDVVDTEQVKDESLMSGDIQDGSLNKSDMDGTILTVDTVFGGDAVGAYDALDVQRLRGATLPSLAASNNNKVLVFRYPAEFRFMTVENLTEEPPEGCVSEDMFGSWVTNVYAVATNDLWAAINYISPSVSLTGGGTYDIGTNIANPTLTWTANKTMTVRLLTGGPAPGVNTNFGAGQNGSYVYPGAPISNAATFTMTVNDGKQIASSSTAFSFLNRMYYGLSTVSTNITDAQIRGLTSYLTSSRLISERQLDPQGVAKYTWVCYPTAFGSATFIMNGFLVTGWQQTTRTFTNTVGYAASYYVYRSPYPADTAYYLKVE